MLALSRLPTFTALLVLVPALANAQDARVATLSGTVSEARNGAPVASVVVQVGSQHASSNAQGAFTFESIPTGRHTLVVTASGYRRIEQSIDLAPGPNQLSPLALEPDSVQLSDIAVTAPTSEAQSKFDDKTGAEVLTEVVSPATLANPNAQNTSDFVKEVAGVAVSQGANGSSSVSVRGIDQRMLRITVDGQRQGGGGNPLDSIPAEIVQSLEVTKSFTPDMDADAVGGVININTGGVIVKDAYIQGRHQVVYNSLAPQPGSRNSLSAAEPFMLFSEEQNASVLATASFDDQRSTRERLSNLREWTPQSSPGPAPFTDEEIPVLTQPLIESTLEHRQRSGLVLNGDARFDAGAFYWRSNLAREWAKRQRDFDDTDPASGVIQALTPVGGTFSGVPLSRRSQDQIARRDSLNGSLGGRWHLGSTEVDGVLGYARTEELEPHTLETGFLSDRTYRITYDLAKNPFAPAYGRIDETDASDTTSGSDPANYRLSYFTVGRTDVDERETSAKLNFRIDLQNAGDYLKFGSKVLRRRRAADADRTLFDSADPSRDMTGLVGSPLVRLDTAGYQFGPAPSAAAVGRLLEATPGVLDENLVQSAINSNGGDFAVMEDLWALYGMGKLRRRNWTFLGGVRVEGTHVSSVGNQMQLDANGQFAGFATVRATNDYVEVLPGIHLRYEPGGTVLYRASVTRSMSRPANADIAPYRTLSFFDHRSRIGAPELKPYLATNVDFSVDRYDDEYGLVSVALFYKKIDHFITDAQYPVTIGDLGQFIEFKRVNGESAKALGVELSWQGPSWTMPLQMGRLTLEADYSFNHGEAHHPTRPGETFPLPRQVDHQGSLKLRDVRGPFSIDAQLSYRSGWWEDLIAPGLDNYITNAWDAQVSASYKLGKESRLTAGVNNMLNRPTRHYAGSLSRMNDWQRNGIEMNVGVQWKL